MALDLTTATPGATSAPLRWLIASDTLMLASMMVGKVAVPWRIVQHGGAADLATYAVFASAIGFIAMPLLSPLGDRFAKGRLISLALALFAAEALALAALAGAGGYRLGWVLALEALPVMALSVILPASASIVSELVPAAALGHSLSLQKSAQSIGRIAGPALAGTALAGVGIVGTLWLHGLMLIAATVAALRLPRSTRAVARRGWWPELRAGLKASWQVPIERGWTLVNFVSWIFMFPAITMMLQLKVQSLGLPGSWLGGCEAALSIGMLAGTFGTTGWLVRRQGRFKARITTTLVQGLALACAGLAPTGLWLALALAVTGLANTAQLLIGVSHRTLARPAPFRSRLSATSMATAQIAATLGPALAALALTRWPIERVYLAFGLIGGLASLGLVLVPGIRAFMSMDHDEVEGHHGRTHPEAFL